MTGTQSNRLLPIIGTVVMLMVLFVTYRSVTSDSASSATLSEVPTAPDPTVDSPAETIRTLTASTAEMQTEIQAMLLENETLRRANAKLQLTREQIETSVTETLNRERREREKEDTHRENRLLSSLTARVDSLSGAVANLRPGDRPEETDIPVGLGLGLNEQVGLDNVVWIEPLDTRDPETVLSSGNQGLLREVSHQAPQAHSSLPDRRDLCDSTTEPDKPVYTVPENATLIGSTALTAFVGRIPVRGRIEDPWPFKVITGADNLAANGLELPDVQGMVWSGTAFGDWTLSCVRGRVDSVTFVFRDGTVRTISRGRSGGNAASQADAVTDDRSLGWISDTQGIPCISGKRITNAPQFLASRAALLALQAGASAFAADETTSSVSSLTGTTTTTVDGDAGRFILGRTVAGGAAEINRYLLERQAQAFDAVFAPPGNKVVINVTEELRIDYEPNGRQLRHASTTNPYKRTRLD